MSIFVWALLPLIIFGFFACLTFVISFRERQFVRLWVPLEKVPSVEPSNANAAAGSPQDGHAAPHQSTNAYAPPRMVSTVPETAGGMTDEIAMTLYSMNHGRQLTALGYTFLGSFRYDKGKPYKIRGDFLLSADRMILAVIEAGSMYAIPVSNVSMISLSDQPVPKYRRGSDGGMSTHALPSVRRTSVSDSGHFCIESITNDGSADVDLSGRTQVYVFQDAPVEELESWHRKRFEDVQVVPFSDQPLNDLQRFRTARFAEAVERGRLKYIDAKEEVLRPTTIGAIRTFFGIYGLLLGRRIRPHRRRLAGRSLP